MLGVTDFSSTLLRFINYYVATNMKLQTQIKQSEFQSEFKLIYIHQITYVA